MRKTIQVRVKPNSRTTVWEAGDDGVWLAQLKAPPVTFRRFKQHE